MSDVPAFVSTGGAVFIAAGLVIFTLLLLAFSLGRSAALGDEQLRRARRWAWDEDPDWQSWPFEDVA